MKVKYFFMGISFSWAHRLAVLFAQQLKAKLAMKNRSHQAPVLISDDGVIPRFVNMFAAGG
ncbi:hypothetical protein ACNKHV_15040 [Shigella flexneri]